MGPKPKDPLERFWSKVRILQNGCWEWTGGTTKGGYGQFYMKLDGVKRKGSHVYAHRWYYELLHGELPREVQLDHTCHSKSDCNLKNDCPHRRCVNPDHLEEVTSKDNLLRSRHEKHTTRRTGICRRGHKIEGDNLYEWTSKKTGYTMRRCIECRRIRERKSGADGPVV